MKPHLTAVFATALAITLNSPAQSYNIRDLGAVAGDSVSAGYGLNASGDAVGTSSGPTAAIATLFSNGKSISLDNNMGDVSIAAALNSNGEVAGAYYNDTVVMPFHAFVVSGGTFFDINSPTLFPQGTKAQAINSSGVVVGIGYLTSSSFHVFQYANGQMVDLGPPRSYQAIPYAMNDAGQIVGSYYTSSTDNGAFLYSNGRFTNLRAPAGTSASAFGVNSLGQVAGAIYFNSGSPPPHAAVFGNGVWTDLGGFSGVATHGTGINTAGEVIATAYFPVQSYHPFRPGKHVALIFRNGVLVDLNTLIPANSGFTVTDSIAINDAGEILCNATTIISGVVRERAVLLTPK